MTIMTVTEAKTHFLELIRKSNERLERFIITKNGKPIAVIMNADEFEGWLETIEIMSNKKRVAEIKKAKRELTKGNVKTFKDVFGREERK